MDNFFFPGKATFENLPQDPTSESAVYRVHTHVGTLTLAAPAVLNSNTVSVVSAAGLTVGDLVHFGQSITLANGQPYARFTQAHVLGINGTTLTLDVRMDYAYPVTADIHFGKDNLGVNGSVTPAVFFLAPPEGVQWDIYQVVFAARSANQMAFDTFAGSPALSVPVQARFEDGFVKNLGAFHSNMDMYAAGMTVELLPKAPSLDYGMVAAADLRNGVGTVPRLSSSSRFAVYVDSDLSANTIYVTLVCHTVMP